MPQTITFPSISDKLTTDAVFVLNATASSGLPVSYSIVSSGLVASLAGDSVTLTGAAGSVTLKASQPGDGTYDPAPDVYRSFAVGAAAQRFVKVAGGGLHSAGVRADGTLWTWGYGLGGQLGDGAAENRNSPVKVGSATNWTSVACGGSHTLAIRSDGTLWAWGSNGFGQLGDSTTINKQSPVQVGSETSWVSAACGTNNSLAVRTDGTLWAWGSNFGGALGDGTTMNRSSPVQVGTAIDWASVTCGANHTLAVRTDGTLWAWGWNNYGQLGDGTTTSRSSPVQVGTATDWASVTCGSNHTLAVRTDGTLWAWGRNDNGQLGNGTTSNRSSPVQVGSAMLWSSVAGGEFHTVAVRTDGALWTWGNNLHGQLGDGTVTNQSSPVQVGSTASWAVAVCGGSHTLALSSDGALWGWGRNLDGSLGDATAQFSRPVRLGSETTWASVSCGGSHTSARRIDGTLWAWGLNDNGQLGDGTTINRSLPVQVGGATNWTTVTCGSEHTVARRSDGTLWAWGRNSFGQLGDGTTTNRSSPAQVGSATNWASVACGASHTVAIRSDRTLWAWGRNSSGQLGDGTTINRSSPVQVGSGTTWVSVACGADHAAAVRMDGTLWVWGSNDSGQLGDGTTINKTSPTQVGSGTTWASVECGSGHTVARRTSGLAWAWGSNFSGQLGDTTATTRTSPVEVGGLWNAVACGGSHTLAIDWFGMAGAWGENRHGQVGDGTLTNRRSPVQIITPALTLVAGGAFHTSAVSADGTIWGWGRNSMGQLGVRDASLPGRAWPQRAQQTLSFTAPASVIFGQPTQLNATSSSGLPISYTVIGPAAVNDNVITSTGTGSLTITAYQPGDGVWQHSQPISVTVSILAAEISVSAIDGSNFGNVAINGGKKTQRFQITNSGQAPLHLSGSPRVVITGTHAADFAVTSQPESPVASGNGSTTFDITFDPSAVGQRTAQISIANNDTDENPFILTIQGGGTAPDMAVSGNSLSIASGDISPSVSDHTDFGNVLYPGNTLTRTFFISNVGTPDLNLIGSPRVVISGPNAGDFVVTTQPSSPVSYLGPSTSITIQFTPGAVSLRTASVSIASDDPDENPYTFAIQGRGTLPEMAVSGNGVSILSGDVTPRTADYTDFGSLLVRGGTLDRLFLIQNTGAGALHLSGTPKVVISGPHATEFVVTFDPIASVPSSSTTGFIVNFNPAGTGVRSASVSIENNDLDENPYTFAIQGVGLAPEIGLSATSADFGDVALTGGTAERGFTISNSGSAALNLTGTPKVQIGGDHVADFTVMSQPSSPLSAGGGSTTLVITFNPTALGPRTATAVIANDDEDENPVMITLQGTGTAPEMSVAGTGAVIASGDMTPDPVDGTDFGSAVLADGVQVRTFTISNSGSSDLQLSGMPLVRVTGNHAADFTVTTQPTTPLMASGGTTTFVMTFDPTDKGTRDALVRIASNDLNANPYTFAVRGHALAPRLAVSGNSNVIHVGDTTPDTANGTDFGKLPLLDSFERRVFNITNEGTAALNLTGTPKVLIGGDHASDFRVAIHPASPVAMGGRTSFELIFDPSQPGLRKAVVSIASDDPDVATFTFAIAGIGGLSTQKTQVITFAAPSTVYLGQSPLALTAFSTSGLPVSLRVVSGPATFASNALTLLNAGTVRVEATQPGDDNYKAAIPVMRTLSIKADPATLTLIGLSQTYDGTPKAITALGTALSVNITYRIGGQETTNPPVNAGSYPVKAVSADVTRTGTLVIAKAPLLVTPDDKRKFAGQPNPPLSSRITGLMGVDTAAVITTQPVLKTTATPASSGGVYPITSSGGAAANYVFVHQQGSLVVESFAGSYEALLVDRTPLPVGRLQVTVAASSKTFTGKLDIATEPSALHITGNLTTDTIQETTTGTATVSKLGVPYQVSFTLPMHGAVQATLLRDSEYLGGSDDGRRLSTKPVLHSGSHTAVLEPALPALGTVPAGAGWATATISKTGLLALTGKLGDGTSFTASVMPDLDPDPGYRLFVQPYLKARTSSFLAGTFSLAEHPSLLNRRHLDQARLTWRKLGLLTDPSYRTNFGPVSTFMMIDPWLQPMAATKTSPAVTLADRLRMASGAFSVAHSETGSLSDGDLPTSLLLQTTGNTVSVTGANLTRWKATLNSTNGTFTGSFELVDGAKKRPVPFSGILRQPASLSDKLIGSGHFVLPPLTVGEQQTGEVLFQR